MTVVGAVHREPDSGEFVTKEVSSAVFFSV